MPYNTNALKKMRVKICLYLLTNTRLYTSRMLRAPTEMTSYFVSKWNRWIWFRYTYIEIYTYKNKSNFQYFWGMNNIINKLHIHYVMKIIKLMKVFDNSSKNIQFIDNFWNQVKAYNFQLNMLKQKKDWPSQIHEAFSFNNNDIHAHTLYFDVFSN